VSISFSKMDTMMRCAKKYYYKYVEKLVPVTDSAALYFGTLVHGICEIAFKYHKKHGKFPELQYLRAASASLLPEYPAEEDIDLVVDALALVERYLASFLWDGDQFTVLAVEEEFTYGNLKGTPDLVIRLTDGRILVIDHKTTSATVDGGETTMRLQGLLYTYLVKNHYATENVSFYFYYLRKKQPAKPTINKSGANKGNVGRLANIDTTYEILNEFVKQHGLQDREDVRHRLGELRDQDRFFWLQRLPQDEYTEAFLLARVREYTAELREKRYFPMSIVDDNGYKSCDKCPYIVLCESELYGYDTAIALEEFKEEE